ncbi:MAG: dihydroneopterin aldolase [Sedimentisphaerales bacterium]|nr:dihydroneopterin aldolase [Sedimentisphaerales bacterium]
MVKILDAIHIHDLQFRCVIGVNDDERREKQDILVNLTLYVDLRAAGASDNIEDTINYKSVKQSILAMGETSQFLLVERLAERIAAICLSFEKVARVRVCVEKPSALRFARSVGVEIVRP